MGDGKDPDIIETDKPNEIITEADRARIARYHSYNTSALVGEGVTRFLLTFRTIGCFPKFAKVCEFATQHAERGSK